MPVGFPLGAGTSRGVNAEETRTGLHALGASVVWAVPLFGLWVVLTDNTHTDDMVAGAVCALVAGMAAELAGLMGRVRFQPRVRWLLRAARFLVWIVQDSVIVLRAMATRAQGEFHRLPFRRPADEPHAVAARALAEGPGSAGPNTYVLEEQGDTLLVHVLDTEHGSLNPIQIADDDA
jgi:multisubunit Na+/H+ antiporter MnhE subunit